MRGCVGGGCCPALGHSVVGKFPRTQAPAASSPEPQERERSREWHIGKRAGAQRLLRVRSRGHTELLTFSGPSVAPLLASFSFSRGAPGLLCSQLTRDKLFIPVKDQAEEA